MTLVGSPIERHICIKNVLPRRLHLKMLSTADLSAFDLHPNLTDEFNVRKASIVGLFCFVFLLSQLCALVILAE